MPTSDESSTNSGAAASRSEASRIFGQRCSATRPLRSSSPLIARLARRRSAARARPRTSRARTARPGLPCSSAAFSAMLVTSARLAHRRACGDDDEVAGLEAAGDLVEVLEAGRRAGERGALERQAVELVELVVQDLVDGAEVLLAVVVGDLEHRRARPARPARAAGASWLQHARLDLVASSSAGAAAARSRARSARTGARCPAAGTAPASASTVAGAAASSSSPPARSRSVTVSASIGSPSS